MTSHLILGVRIVEEDYQRIKVENIDLNGKVRILKKFACEKLKKSHDAIELMFGGVILQDESTIASYGIKQGFTIHVLAAQKPPAVEPIKKLTESEIRQLVATLVAYKKKNQFPNLSNRELVNKVAEAIPRLAENSAAIALLLEPELLSQLADLEVMKRAIDIYPILQEALPVLIKTSKETEGTVADDEAGTSTGYLYSLAALSDEDDDPEAEAARNNLAVTRRASSSAITAEQLAAAVERAATANLPSTETAATEPTQLAASAVITSEMFGNALQQAFASSSAGVSSTTPAAPSPSLETLDGEETMDVLRARFQPQLEKMGEIGLTNEMENISALQATAGDLQAAIDLVFNDDD